MVCLTGKNNPREASLGLYLRVTAAGQSEGWRIVKEKRGNVYVTAAAGKEKISAVGHASAGCVVPQGSDR